MAGERGRGCDEEMGKGACVDCVLYLLIRFGP